MRRVGGDGGEKEEPVGKEEQGEGAGVGEEGQGGEG